MDGYMYLLRSIPGLRCRHRLGARFNKVIEYHGIAGIAQRTEGKESARVIVGQY